MRRQIAYVVAGVAFAYASAAVAESPDTHKVLLPQSNQWEPAPASLPAGAEAAVLYGDPRQEGMFALRIKAPKGYRIPPHTHPKPEAITVISGKLNLGMGAKAVKAAGQALPAGSFASMPANAAHFVLIDEDAVVQINAMGPWAIDYVDPRDDPRLNIAPTNGKASAQRPD